MEVKKNKLKINNGFSFIEVMISVFLVSIGLLATMSLLAAGLRGTIESRSQLIASFLAQEGVELVRAQRDDNLANSLPALTGFSAGSKALDYTLNSSTNYQLNIDGNGFYVHSSGTPTKFYRRIYIPTLTAEIMTIRSFVTWSGEGGNIGTLTPSTCTAANKCAYAEDILTRWAE